MTAPWEGERLAIGGLMRCCTGTLLARLLRDDAEPKDGEVVRCQHSPDDASHVMVRDGGVWKWAKPEAGE